MTDSNHDMPSANNRSPRRAHNPASASRRWRLPSSCCLGLALGGALAVELFVVERLPELTVENLDAAEKLWEASGPKSYDLDLTIEGAQPGVVHVEVRDGVTTAMQRDGLAPQQRRVWDVWAVPGMFETIERELNSPPTRNTKWTPPPAPRSTSAPSSIRNSATRPASTASSSAAAPKCIGR